MSSATSAPHDLGTVAVGADESARPVQDRFPAPAGSSELGQQEPAKALLAAGNRGTIVAGNRGLGGSSALMLCSVGLAATAAVRSTQGAGWVPFATAGAQARRAPWQRVSVRHVLPHAGSAAPMLDLDGMARGIAPEVHPLTDRVRALHSALAVRYHRETGTSLPRTQVVATLRPELTATGRSRHRLNTVPGRVADTLAHHTNRPMPLVPAAFTHEADEK